MSVADDIQSLLEPSYDHPDPELRLTRRPAGRATPEQVAANRARNQQVPAHDAPDRVILQHLGLPESDHPVTRRRNARAVADWRTRQQTGRPATFEERNSRLADNIVSDSTSTEDQDRLVDIFDGEPLHLNGRTRVIDTSPEPPQTQSPRSQQFGRYYREHSRGSNAEYFEVGYQGPGEEPQRDEFGFAHDHREAASLLMKRRYDRNYAINSPDIEDGDYEQTEQGHKQGILINSEEASPWRVATLYSTKGSHTDVMRLLGMAGEHALRTSGRFPAASNDLSAHSTRLVHGLADRGIIEAPTSEMRNSIDWDHGAENARNDVRSMARHAESPYEDNTTEVSQEEAARGGRLMRQVLRGSRPQVERGLPEAQPLVNARTTAGRFAEFEHHQRLQEKADRPQRSETRGQEGLW